MLYIINGTLPKWCVINWGRSLMVSQKDFRSSRNVLTQSSLDHLLSCCPITVTQWGLHDFVVCLFQERQCTLVQQFKWTTFYSRGSHFTKLKCLPRLQHWNLWEVMEILCKSLLDSNHWITAERRMWPYFYFKAWNLISSIGSVHSLSLGPCLFQHYPRSMCPSTLGSFALQHWVGAFSNILGVQQYLVGAFSNIWSVGSPTLGPFILQQWVDAFSNIDSMHSPTLGPCILQHWVGAISNIGSFISNIRLVHSPKLGPGILQHRVHVFYKIMISAFFNNGFMSYPTLCWFILQH